MIGVQVLLYFFHPVCSCTSFRFSGTSGLSYDKKQIKMAMGDSLLDSLKESKKF